MPTPNPSFSAARLQARQLCIQAADACRTAATLRAEMAARRSQYRKTREESLHRRSARGDRSGPQDRLPPSSEALVVPCVTVYVWGHGRPQPATTRLGCRYTPAAVRYAAEQGWDEDGFAAWAFEVRLLGSWAAVVQQFVPPLEQDPAVAGWAIQGTGGMMTA
jgi:hypothetical protein